MKYFHKKHFRRKITSELMTCVCRSLARQFFPVGSSRSSRRRRVGEMAAYDGVRLGTHVKGGAAVAPATALPPQTDLSVAEPPLPSSPAPLGKPPFPPIRPHPVSILMPAWPPHRPCAFYPIPSPAAATAAVHSRCISIAHCSR